MPRSRIPTDPDAPIAMDAEQIRSGAESVEVSWGRGLEFVQIGVRAEGADENRGDPLYSHYAALEYETLRQFINLLRRAQRHAFKA